MSAELRIGVAGAGAMGIDHIERISQRIAGARVSAVIEPDPVRAAAGAAKAPGSAVYPDLAAALDDDALDALLIAVPGPFHEQLLITAIQAKLPTLCEKPLTPDAAGSLRVVEAENGQALVQVGFMRRFDREYAYLREQIQHGQQGDLLLLHCVHRNPAVPDNWITDMLITDSLVHEIDIVPWLAGSPITAVTVLNPRRNSLAPEGLGDPILAVFELDNGVIADVEVNVSMQFGYQVGAEAVFEAGLIKTGEASGPRHWENRKVWVAQTPSFVERFADAYDEEVRRWVIAAAAGGIDGPSAFDGYRAAVVTEAALEALHTGRRVQVPSVVAPA